jgi:hypothetical protein
MLISDKAGGMCALAYKAYISMVKKLPSEEELRARLRELSVAARRLRQELEQNQSMPTKPAPRLRGLVHDRPLRSSRKKR